MRKGQLKDKIVLVAVLKNKRDLEILLKKKWYRIPMMYAPKHYFNYLAFYQPILFGLQGKQIQYLARVSGCRIIQRRDILPTEPNHPRAKDYYYQIRLGNIKKLAHSIRNVRPRRISFGFTTLDHLSKSRDILQLYNIPPIEEIFENALKKAAIKAVSQYYVSAGKRRFCLDFAVFCQKGKIAIECDNKKAHSNPAQQKKDKVKDNLLKTHGWKVIRLKESAILSNLKGCLLKTQKAIQKLGGLK